MKTIGGSLLRVEDLRIEFGARERPLVAVDGITLTVNRGETVALVGESGSGKSLASLAILRLTPPSARVTVGRMMFDGQDLSILDDAAMQRIRGRRIAMIFQDPMSSLNGIMTIGRQITESLEYHHGLRGEASRRRAVELLEMVDMPAAAQRVRQYPHELSGGMRQRAMIAMALAAGPDLLIADEPTTALDVTIQAQIMELLTRLQAELSMSLLLISHDLGVVAGIADRIYVMYAGRVAEDGPVHAVFNQPRHPYSQALLATVLQLAGPAGTRLAAITGSPPALGPRRDFCPFAPRCPHVAEVCRLETPLLRPIGSADQEVSCHLAEMIVRPT